MSLFNELSTVLTEEREEELVQKMLAAMTPTEHIDLTMRLLFSNRAAWEVATQLRERITALEQQPAPPSLEAAYRTVLEFLVRDWWVRLSMSDQHPHHDFMEFIKADKTVQAIKEIRAFSGMGLRESKLLVDTLRGQRGMKLSWRADNVGL